MKDLARFIPSKGRKKKIRADGSLKYNAFLPNPKDMGTSFVVTDNMKEEEIWATADEHICSVNTGPIQDRGDIAAADVASEGLELMDDKAFRGHRNAKGWPVAKEEQQKVAKVLAEKATPIVRPSDSDSERSEGESAVSGKTD